MMAGLLCLTWNNHYSAFSKLLSNLYLKDLYCDATIVCDGKYYPVHRLVLSTCSDYFEEIFDKIKCKHPFIIIKDIKPQETEALLNYMYKGEVNVLQDSLPELIKAAESLRIRGLAVSDDIPDKNICSIEKKRKLSNESPNAQFKKKKPDKKIHIAAIKENNENGQVASDNKELCEEISRKESEHESPCLPKSVDGTYLEGDHINEDLPNLENTEVKVEAEELPSDLEIISSQTEELEKNLVQANSSISLSTTNSFSSDFPRQPDNHHFQDTLIPETIPQSSPEFSSSHHFSNFSDNCEVDDLHLSSSLITTSFRGLLGGINDQSQSTKAIASGVSHQPFKCPECPYKSNKKYNLKSHYMYRHSNVRPICCQLCPYRCVIRSDLKRHMVKHLKSKDKHPFV